MLRWVFAPAVLASLLLSGCSDPSHNKDPNDALIEEVTWDASVTSNTSFISTVESAGRSSNGWLGIYNQRHGHAWSGGLSPELLDKMAHGSNPYKFVSFTLHGGWILYGNDGSWWYRNIPTAAVEKIKECRNAGKTIKLVTFSPQGGWVILLDNGGWHGTRIPSALANKMHSVYQAGGEFKHVAFDNAGHWILMYDNSAWGVWPPELQNKVMSHGTPKKVSLCTDGAWLILYGSRGYHGHGLPQGAADELSKIHAKGYTIDDWSFVVPYSSSEGSELSPVEGDAEELLSNESSQDSELGVLEPTLV